MEKPMSKLPQRNSEESRRQAAVLGIEMFRIYMGVGGGGYDSRGASELLCRVLVEVRTWLQGVHPLPLLVLLRPLKFLNCCLLLRTPQECFCPGPPTP